MTKERETLKLALEALETGKNYGVAIDVLQRALAERFCDNNCTWRDHHPDCDKAEHLAQHQEPFGYFRYDLRLDAWVQNRAGLTGTPFYTSPPANANAGKPWVHATTWRGLTEEELKPLCDENHIIFGAYTVDFIQAIEAKLREKNTGEQP